VLSEGQAIGNYRILSKIGTGGMGAVYLAEHPLIGKKVALKVIHRELSSNKEVIQRFFQEAKAVNKIGNEHIIEVHDFGQSSEGDHFYIMEYLEGRTLASLLGREKVLPTTRALHIGAQIASALSAAHTAGVIHRDLKPDNIMLVARLGDPDFVKVLDFGLAKFFSGGGAVALTAAGVVLGTPQYMSPEACESKKDVDHRTDIYAVGILLFQMMCGQLPFDGETMGEVLVKQVTQAPPAPRGFNGAVPPSVEQIILRCLAKQPDRRFPTMLALRDALMNPDAYLSTSPPIMPARSVAPGSAPADARTMIAQVHARAQEDPRDVGNARTAIGDRLPLGAGTAPTMVGKRSAPRAAVHPNGDDVGAMATQIGVGGAPMTPGMVPPVPAKNSTMVIATPAGYSSRPPRAVWPIVLVVVLLGAMVGGGVYVAMQDKKQAGEGDAGGTAGSGVAIASAAAATADASEATAMTDAAEAPVTIDAASAAASADAAPTPTPAPADAAPRVDADTGSVVIEPTVVKVRLETEPSGAEVRRKGKRLGRTPYTLEMTVEKGPITVELRHKGYRSVTREIDATDDMTIRETLTKAPRGGGKTGGTGPKNGSGTGSGDTLLNPDDM
jgi:tRNA A-37 threonylcarbamoyl transferase component Bud32